MDKVKLKLITSCEEVQKLYDAKIDVYVKEFGKYLSATFLMMQPAWQLIHFIQSKQLYYSPIKPNKNDKRTTTRTNRRNAVQNNNATKRKNRTTK